MKKAHYLPLLVLLFVLLGCQDDNPEKTILQEPNEPTFSADLPKFPAVAIHIIEREYALHSNKPNGRTLGLTLDEYLEQRLLELFPDQAYAGMIEETRATIGLLTEEYNQYVIERNAYETSIGADVVEADEYVPFTTLDAEIVLTEMTQDEIDLFQELESFASADEPIDLETMQSITENPNGRVSGGVITTASILFVPSVAWRVLQSKNRAEQKAAEYFPGLTDPGEIGDAFRHIFVSMHLKRYITEPAAWAVMGGVEARRDLDGTNLPRDRTMDLHNNKIGRNTKYGSFRDKRLKYLNNWKRWSENVRDYVNNSGNGTRMSWSGDNDRFPTDTPPSSNSAAENQEKNVSDKIYIWYE